MTTIFRLFHSLRASASRLFRKITTIEVNSGSPSRLTLEVLGNFVLANSKGVLHVGAHLGQESEQYARHHLPVLWVEAIPAIASQLEEKIVGLKNQMVVQACVSNVSGQVVRFNVANNAGMSSSIFQFGSAVTQAGRHFRGLDLRMSDSLCLTTTTLDDLLRSLGKSASAFDHWVLDVQGAEFLVLSGATDSLRDCLSLMVECSTVDVYSGSHSWDEIKAFLSERGFEPLWECRGHMDVLFLRQFGNKVDKT